MNAGHEPAPGQGFSQQRTALERVDRGAPLAPVLADAIRDLAAERVARLDTEDDRDAHRVLAQVALEHCHTLTITVRRQKDTIARLHGIVREHINAPAPRRDRRAA